MDDADARALEQLRKGAVTLSASAVVAVWFLAVAMLTGDTSIYLWISFGVLMTAALWLIAEMLQTWRNLEQHRSNHEEGA